jgi:hypothetical protein
VKRVFNWDEAARLILASEVPYAQAGLLENWWWTAGDILQDFQPVPEGATYTFLGSLWATPAIVLGSGEPLPCFITADQVPASWLEPHGHTDLAKVYWPASALAILRGEG